MVIGLWALRTLLLAPSQYQGYEYVLLFFGAAYLWVVFRLGLFGDAPYGPRKVTGSDAWMAVLSVIVLACVAASVL